MNRTAASLFLAAAMAAGFAAGWFQSHVASTAPRPGPAKAAPPAAVPVIPLPALLPAFRELQTAAECQAFLVEAPRRYAGSHPLAIQAIKDYALRRWLELDAESALQEAERHPGNEFNTEGFAPDLFRVWLDLNVESAVSAFNQASPLLAKNVRVAFLTALADKDPVQARAVSRTGRGSSGELWDVADTAIFSRWARVDPQRALREAVTDTQRLAVVREMAGADRSQALSTALNSQPGGGFLLLHSGLLPDALTANPAMAAQALASASARDLTAAADDWLAMDSTGALAWARSQPADSALAESLRLSAARRSTLSDPEEAIRLLTKETPPSTGKRGGEDGQNTRARVMSEAVSSLAAASPDRALEILRNDPAAAREGGMTGFFVHAFATDTGAAVDRFKEWAADPALKDAVLDAAVQALRESSEAGTHDPRALLTALPDLAEKAGGEILGAWAATDPTGVADFILEQASAGKPLPDPATGGVLTQLAISQPKYTSLWLQRLPDARLRQTTAAVLAANWNAFDPEATAAWINSLPDGPLREAALSGYDRARRAAQPSPEPPARP